MYVKSLAIDIATRCSCFLCTVLQTERVDVSSQSSVLPRFDIFTIETCEPTVASVDKT